MDADLHTGITDDEVEVESVESPDEKRWRQCGRKRMYPSCVEAQHAVEEMQAKAHKSVVFVVIQCDWCGGCHIGRRRTFAARERKRIRGRQK
jgi:thiol:disulfide interchange protein